MRLDHLLSKENMDTSEEKRKPSTVENPKCYLESTLETERLVEDGVT